MRKLRVAMLGFANEERPTDVDGLEFVNLVSDDLKELSPLEFVAIIPNVMRRIDLVIVNEDNVTDMPTITAVQFAESKKIPCIGVTTDKEKAVRLKNFSTLLESIEYIQDTYLKFFI